MVSEDLPTPPAPITQSLTSDIVASFELGLAATATGGTSGRTTMTTGGAGSRALSAGVKLVHEDHEAT
eukprot:1130099-Prymnesium_polylepis.1